MQITVMDPAVGSALISGIAVAGVLVCAVILVLSDDARKSKLFAFNQSLNTFTIPLLYAFAYIAIIWAARILTR